MRDAEFLLKVKNDYDVRMNSIVTHRRIRREAHIDWLQRKLKDKKSALYVITVDNRRAGDVRLDDRHDGTHEISIRLLPKYRSTGIGRMVIRRFDQSLIAKFVEGNIPSMNLFIKCGYVFRSYRDGVYIMEKCR